VAPDVVVLIDFDGGAMPGTTAGPRDLKADGGAGSKSDAELPLIFWAGK